MPTNTTSSAKHNDSLELVKRLVQVLLQQLAHPGGKNRLAIGSLDVACARLLYQRGEETVREKGQDVRNGISTLSLSLKRIVGWSCEAVSAEAVWGKRRRTT